MSKLRVVKRSGKREELDINKIHRMVEEACKDISNVSASQVEINSGLQFYDDIKTNDIQDILIKSAADLVSLETPNYQFVAARLLLFSLIKKVFGNTKGQDFVLNYPSLEKVIKTNIDHGVYDPEILNWYSKKEIEKLNSYIDHERDKDFTYTGLEKVVTNCLVQDRISKKIYETPQFMYMLIAMVTFHRYPQETRLSYVKKYYDAISTFRINLPTPIIAGVRTRIKQYASCVLVDVGDSMQSIFSSTTALGYYIARRAGIGLNFGRIRAIKSKIREGEVEHTGVIPFLRVFEATIKSCTQNGIRGGNATSHCPIWHLEIEDIIVLKNNKGTEDNRVRKLDYSIQISKLFFERYINDEQITLFSPNDVPGLYEAYGMPEFDELYRKYEADTTIRHKKVSAQDLFNAILKERAETGRIYLMFIDHCNSHSSWTEQVVMSNLCQEITQPTKPIIHIDDPVGEIGTCILSAFNVGKFPVWSERAKDEIEELSDLIVRGLEEIIDIQEYPVLAGKTFTLRRRSLGIGYIGLAHYLAKNKVKYDDPKAQKIVHDLSEAVQYNLIKASVNIAKEKGKCDAFHLTKYGQGILPIDTYKKDVDDIVNGLSYDWEALREEVKKYGMRHSTLTAQMPSESSSVISNETNGIEKPRFFLSTKMNKKGALTQVVPQYHQLKNFYSLLWDEKNEGYIKIVALMQKFFDQSISTNLSYNPEHYENEEIPDSERMRDILLCYKYGIKTLYYDNTNALNEQDDKPLELKKEETVTEEDCESCKL